MTDEPQHHGHPPIGSAAEEAAKLFGVLAGWATSATDHVDTGAIECDFCPICRTVHVIRGVSPEVRDHLATAAASLMQAAAAVLQASATPAGANKRSASVQPILIDDLDDGGDWPAGPSRPSEGEGS